MADSYYRCSVCGYESHEHTTCPNCMGAALSGLPRGGLHTPKPKQARSAMLDELAAAVNARPGADEPTSG